MSQSPGGRNDGVKDEIYRSLADHRRRRLLSILSERPAPVADVTLAKRLAAAESTRSVDEVDADEAEPVLVELRHSHLPRLAGAGLVEYDRDEGTVAETLDGSPADAVAPHLRRLDPAWDEIVAALADRRRRLVHRVAAAADEPLAVPELARRVAERDADGSADRIEAALHHNHLPALADAGLIAYDRDAGTVAALDHPDVTAGRFDFDRHEPGDGDAEGGRPVLLLGSR